MSHMVLIVSLLLSSILVFPQTVQGAGNKLEAHTLPSELQSVNGSDLNGGCNNVNSAAGNRFCPFADPIHTSSLVDGVIPSVDNFDSGWADGFFTLNRNGASSVMVGFEFVVPVNITQVELVLFDCPVFGIGASDTSVYTQTPDDNGLFNFNLDSAVFEGSHQTEQSSCGSTFTVSIPLSDPTYLSAYLFVVFNFDANNTNDWVFIADIRFSNVSTVSAPTPTSTSSNTVSSLASATPGPTTPPDGNSSATIIIVVVAAVGGLIIILCIIAIIALFILHRQWRKKRSQIENLQSVMMENDQPNSVELTSVKAPPTKDTQKAGDSGKVDDTHYYSIVTETSKQHAAVSSPSGNIKDRKSFETYQYVDADNISPGFSGHSPIPKTHSHNPIHTQQEEPSPEHIYTAIEKVPPQVPPQIPEQSDDLLEYLQTKRTTDKEREDTDIVYSTIRSTPSPLTAIKSGVDQRERSSSPPCVSPPQRNTSSPNSRKNRHSPSPKPNPSPRRRGPSPIKQDLSNSQQLEVSSNSVNRSSSSPGKQSGGISSIARRSWSPQPGLERRSASPVHSPNTLSPTSPLFTTQQNSTGLVTLSKPLCDSMLTNTSYQSIDTDLNQVYAEPSVVRSASDFQLSSAADDSVYSEPIQPSLFRISRSSSSASPELEEDIHPYAPIYTVPSSPPQPDEKPIEITAADIKEVCEIGSGNFGEVVLAQTVGLSQKDLRIGDSNDKNESFYVAVKKLGKGVPRSMKETFEKEARFMGRLRNENVVSLLAVCYTGTPFLVMEYMEKGDLNQHLQKYKAIVPDTAAPIETLIKTGTLLNMCNQIASAMKYLASHNFVHRDLATRNCLVGPNNTIKIADFGLSRNLYESHYYRVRGTVILPIRWMATECFFGKFSQKSDVWAFGVTMWEIYTLGKTTPYSWMSDHDLIQDAQRNEERSLLTKPEDCPQEVYDHVMLKSWKAVANDRPTFLELHAMLSMMQM